MKGAHQKITKLLIYRPGSIGDASISVPALHLIAKTFPTAERVLLTQSSVSPLSKGVFSLLSGSGLIHREILFTLENIPWQLCRKLRKEKFDVFIYLGPKRSLLTMLRYNVFAWLSGMQSSYGLAIRNRAHIQINESLYEHESSRLLRTLRKLGIIDLDNPSSWSLGYRAEEIARVQATMPSIMNREPSEKKQPFIAICTGSKVSCNQWPKERWHELIKRIDSHANKYALVFVGGPGDRVFADELSRLWPGESLNLCTKLSPRESAYVLAHAVLYIGHDSGPMHLAALGNTPCIGIYSSRNLPGIWFPYGKQHSILYTPIACQNCGLTVCEIHDKRCIRSISVETVQQAVESYLLASAL